MATRYPLILFALVAIPTLRTAPAQSPTPAPEGRVTAVFHDVQLLPEQAGARPAVINDKVDDGTALRTGDDSRSELTFADLTITRLGANTVFSFNKAGRSVRLDSGSILLYAQKNSGAAEISTKAVSVAISGTTVIFESNPASYDRLIVLEGDARFSLNKYPDQSTVVHGGQLLNVNAGAKKLPRPGRVDLRRILNTHPLIKNFPPLPSLDLILAIQNPGSNPPNRTVGGINPRGGRPPVYAPNPTGPPGPITSGSGYPVPVPTPSPIVHRPTRTPRPIATVTPRSTPKPTPRRPIHPPKPPPPPRKRATPTPTPVQIR